MTDPRHKQGSALILVLWTIILVSLLIGNFVFEMHIEAKIATAQRHRFKAREIAQSGFEYARALLATPVSTEEDDPLLEDDAFQQAIDRIDLGLNVTDISYELPDGRFTLSISQENSKRNITKLSEDDWDLLLEQCGHAETERDTLYDCYTDWIDEGDLHQLNGAESDDEFYADQNYRCKNAAVESIAELALIKNFTPLVLYGGVTEDGEPIIGLADQLTVWGDGLVNINTASKETLMTFIELAETDIDELMRLRDGLDGEPGTEDDGFDSLSETGLSSSQFTTSGQWLNVISRAETDSFTYEIRAIIYIQDTELQILEWNEGFAAESPDSIPLSSEEGSL